MKKDKQISIFFGFICFILSFAIILQIRTLKTTNSPFLKIEADNDLRNEVLRLKEKYDNASKQLEKAEKKLIKVREQIVSNDEDLQNKQQEIKNSNEVIGLTDVVGPGVIITIKTKQIDNQLKEDIDAIMNELKNSGAEAISINDERIIFNSSIVCNENNIEVNGTIIQSPFEIKAVGDSKLIYNDLVRPGGYIELINDRMQKVEIIKANRISIKRYTGKMSRDYIRNV